MTSVDAQSTMDLKGLSPKPMKDSSLFPLEIGDDDSMLDDSFHLFLSDDEVDKKTEKKMKENMNENSEKAAEKKCMGSGATDGDEVDSTSVGKELCENSELPSEEPASSLKAKEDAAKQVQVNAELLKNQIMDTEDLLKIVDKETDENDKEIDENDTDSSSENSPRSMDETDSDEFVEGDETETEKMDVEESSSEKSKADSGADASLKFSKRSLNDLDAATCVKKMKLQTAENSTTPLEKTADQDKEKEKEVTPEREATPPQAPVRIFALNAIDEYLKIKSSKKLTYKDLEQIVLQKMCEAICHKSEIGELRHQLGVQEQMVEKWKKEVERLTKQARDLEIVNRRLSHEIRIKTEGNRPLIPLKITRSVGIQVLSAANLINNVIAPQRRVGRPRVANPQSTIAPAKQNRFNAANRANAMNRASTPNEVITPNKVTTTNRITTPKKVITRSKVNPVTAKKVISPKPRKSLLSKAVRNSAAAATTSATSLTPTNAIVTPALTPITTPTLTAITTPTATFSTTSANKPKTKVSAKPGGKQVAQSKTVIDSTDGDNKKSASTNPTQGVRIVSAPVKTVVTTAGVVKGPQLHQRVLATDPSQPGAPQKLMPKVNPKVIVQPVRFAPPFTPIQNNTIPVETVLRQHAPLPPPPTNHLRISSSKPVPPKPHLSIKPSNGGLILSWKMPYNLDDFEAIASYQLYAYQETTSPPSSWRKVGDLKALALPMACTLTQFPDGNKYHFAVRAVDVQNRMGPFSDPEQILP